MFQKDEMRRMRLRLESIDGQVIDSNKPDSLLNKKLGSIRIQVNKLFVEFSILPVPGVFGFEENSFNAFPVQWLQLRAPNRTHLRNFENGGGTGERVERNFVQALAVVDHVERRIDMSAGVGAHLDGRQSNGMGFIPRQM